MHFTATTGMPVECYQTAPKPAGMRGILGKSSTGPTWPGADILLASSMVGVSGFLLRFTTAPIS